MAKKKRSKYGPHCFKDEKTKKLYVRIRYKARVLVDGIWKDVWNQESELLEKVYASGKDAEQWYLEKRLQYKQDGSQAFAKDNTVLNNYLDEWLATIKDLVRQRTYIDYRAHLRLYWRPAIGKKRLSEIDAVDIRRVVNQMKTAKRKVKGKEVIGYDARTIQYAHRVISMALKYAVEPLKLIKENPASYVKPPSVKRKERRWLKGEAAKKFLEVLGEDKNGVVLTFALATGMRPEELAALQWKDIDLDKATATVQRTIYRRREKQEALEGIPAWRFEETKTQKSRRLVTFRPEVAQLLAVHKKRQLEERLKAGPNWQTKDLEGNEMNLIFCTEVGSPLLFSNFESRVFKPMLKKAGLDDMRLVDLRHSFATLLLERGVATKLIADLMGHCSTRVTEDIYLKTDEDMKRSATNTMSEIFAQRK